MNPSRRALGLVGQLVEALMPIFKVVSDTRLADALAAAEENVEVWEPAPAFAPAGASPAAGERTPDQRPAAGQPIYYLSGPMTGYPEHNFPAFSKAAADLRAAGLAVVSPHELDPEHGKPWEFYLRNDIRALLDCTHVATLPHWRGSRGACLEGYVAEKLLMPVCSVADLLTTSTTP